MLSKEEIEEGKAHLWWMLDNGIFTSEDEPHIEAVLEYIEQLEQEKADRTSAESYEDSYIAKLESDKQKLIEKLEEDKKIFGDYEERKQMAKEQLYEKRWKMVLLSRNIINPKRRVIVWKIL